MYILALDTTAKTVSVCISKEENDTLVPLVRRTSNCGFTHSETLLPMISECLCDAQINIDDIGALAVSQGPGSFTGVRIGVSCIKGLSFALASKKLSHKCIGVSSLEALAQNAIPYSGYIICPVMDARRSQFYNALFKVGRNGMLKRLSEDSMPTAKELYAELSEKYAGKKILLVGDGALLCKKLFDSISTENGECPFTYKACDFAHMYQDAYSVCVVAMQHIKESRSSAKDLSPTYLRASQAERERLEKEARRKEIEEKDIKV